MALSKEQADLNWREPHGEPAESTVQLKLQSKKAASSTRPHTARGEPGCSFAGVAWANANLPGSGCPLKWRDSLRPDRGVPGDGMGRGMCLAQWLWALFSNQNTLLRGDLKIIQRKPPSADISNLEVQKGMHMHMFSIHTHTHTHTHAYTHKVSLYSFRIPWTKQYLP